MSTGLYPNNATVERWLAGAVSAQTIAQPYFVPFDSDVLGLILYAGTAPGGSNTFSVNVNNTPTSQTGGAGTTVNAYNLWTATNVPTVTGTAHSNLTAQQTLQVVENIPYAINYPLPGPSGTTGFVTAQSTAQTTTNPVTSPPLVYKFSMSALVAPDNTYTDYNGFTGTPASFVHVGDVLSFVISGGSPGSAANLQMELILAKR
jgi:hypothetical protein